jgi:hypothetical protein
MYVTLPFQNVRRWACLTATRMSEMQDRSGTRKLTRHLGASLEVYPTEPLEVLTRHLAAKRSAASNP